MRSRSLLVLVSCAGVAVLAGCGDRPPGLKKHTSGPGATRVIHDLAERAKSAAVVRHAPLVDIGAIESADAMVDGWSDSEIDPGSGASFAWAAADRAVVETTVLDAEIRQLRMRCRPFQWDGSPEQGLSVVVNGREVGDTVLRPGFHDYSFPLSEGTVRTGSNRVDLRFSWAAAPADHLPNNTDRRTLAAAFEWISFGPPRAERPEAMRDPVAKDGDLLIPPGSGLRYRLRVPKDAVLDLGLVAEPAGESDLRGRVWVARPGEPTTESVVLDPAIAAGDRVRFEIRAEDVVELGLATTGDGPDGAALVFHTPRILGGGDVAEDSTSVLLVVVDTLRADYVGAYGAQVNTPNIDALAARGVRFSRARSHIPITGPSHASLFTSLLPMEHGVRNNAQELRASFPTLAETLQASGRRTAAVISLGVLQRQFGFDRGFDVYGDAFPRDWLKDAGEVTDEALEIAGESLSEPYLLWVHYSDPHEPYAPTGENYARFELRLDGDFVGEIDAGGRGYRYDLELPAGDSVLEFVPRDEEPGRVYRVDNLLIDDTAISVEAIEGWNVIPRRMDRTTYESEFPASVRLNNPAGTAVKTGMLVSCKKLLSKPEIRDAYAGETEFVDLQFGRLLAGLEERGLMDNTLVIFVSDHGEGLGNHDHVGHISQLYDSLLHVPLILAWQGHLAEGIVIEDSVSLVDLFPTIADLLRLDVPSTSSGASLAPLLRGETMPVRPVIAATYRPESFSDKRAIVVDGFKYIHSWKDDQEKEELYQVINDPGELENLARLHPEVLERLRAELQRRLDELSESSSVDVDLSEEDKAHLRALGYIH